MKKNIKSKIVVPALGLILLSTAASISGSVAWFTANRTAQITAGEFAVVKTGDNLAVTLDTGIGTSAVDNDNTIKSVTVNSDYSLTDSSFNHVQYETYNYTGAQIAAGSGITVANLKTDAALTTGATYADGKLSPTEYSGADTVYTFYKAKTTIKPTVVTPNVPRDAALKTTAIDGLADQMERGTDVYTAFTWTMQFSVTFTSASTADLGLFLDLSSKDTWTHEAVTIPEGQSIAGYYGTADCSGSTLTGTAGAGGQKVYQKVPDASGKGFRIAFVPTTVSTDSLGLTKIWAPNRASSGAHFAGSALNTALDSNDYASETLSYNGTTYAKAVSPSLIDNTCDKGVPVDGDQNAAYYLANNENYLGFFKCPGTASTVSMTFTCVAWFEGTDADITGATTVFETVTSSMRFGVSNLGE